MTDYKAEVHGVFPNGRVWSTSRNITSGQDIATLLTTWANAWTTAWNDGVNGWKLAYPAGTSITSFAVRQLGAGMREVAVKSVPAALVGTNVNASLPTNITVVYSWSYSGGIGKTKRGNMRMPAPAENEVVNDKLVPGTQALFTTAMKAVQAAIQADGSTFFVYPRFTTSTGVPAFTKSVIDTVKTRDKVGRAYKRYKKEPASYA